MFLRKCEMKETDLRDLEKGNMIRISWRDPDTNELKYGVGRFNKIHYDKKK